jgi:hypothetical protein
MKTAMSILLVALVAPFQSQQPASWKDPSSHMSRFIPVAPGACLTGAGALRRCQAR